MSTEYEIALKKAEWLAENREWLSFREKKIMRKHDVAVVLVYEAAFDKIMELSRKNGKSTLS